MLTERLQGSGHEATHRALKEISLPDVNHPSLFESESFRDCAQQVRDANALILASPVYNWSLSAELKKFIEVIGSTDSAHPSPFFDKLVSFVFAAGLPHSYMVLQTAAIPLMLDFRCIINPHQAYLHNRHWDENETLTPEGSAKLDQMLKAHLELTTRLQGYQLTNSWQV